MQRWQFLKNSALFMINCARLSHSHTRYLQRIPDGGVDRLRFLSPRRTAASYAASRQLPGRSIWSLLYEQPKRYWHGSYLPLLPSLGWYGELKSIAWRFRSQALESYCLWHGPLVKSLRGTLWPAERWLLVTGLLRNSRSWVPSFAAGIMRPERWLCVAAVTSLNTVGAHIPRMTALLLAQILARTGSADNPSRDAYFPMYRSPSPTVFSAKDASSSVASLLGRYWEEISIWIRLTSLMICFLPLFLSYPLTSVSTSFWYLWLGMLRRTLETCGPAFIKWGQWASTRRDLFNPDVAEELRKLQTDSPAHSGETSRKIIESSFGFPIDVLFTDFEKTPIASGSIGQVHRAKLSPVGAAVTGSEEGKDVAIKVRHPNVEIEFQRDMKLMLWIARCVDRSAVLKGFNIQEMIGQFATPMAEQVDLCMEAANLQCFRHNFRRNPRVIFPEPLFPLVTSDILVETFHLGTSVQDLVDNVKTKESELAELGSASFFDMVVQHNLLHADLHPGNILVQYSPPSTKFTQCLEQLSHQISKLNTWNPFSYLLKRIRNNKQPTPHIILLDAGMATQLSDKERFHMMGLFRAVADMDGDATADHTLAFAGIHQSCPDPEGFRRDLLHHFEVIKHPDWSETEFATSVDAFGRVIDIIREHRVTLPGQIVSCLFTVFLLEGWASKLDPDHSILLQIRGLMKKLDWSLEKSIKASANKLLTDGVTGLSLETIMDRGISMTQ